MLVVFRAHNEESNIGGLVATTRAAGFRTVVCASACTDRTEAVAVDAGADVFRVEEIGLGNAYRATFDHVAGEAFVLLDSDLTELRLDAVNVLADVAAAGDLGRGAMDQPGRASSQLAAQAAALGVELPPIAPQALTTAYSSWPADVAAQLPLADVPPRRGACLFLAVSAWRAGLTLVEVPVGSRAHQSRGEEHIANLVASNQASLERLAATS